MTLTTAPSTRSAVPREQKPYHPNGTIRDLWAYQGREVLCAGPAGTGKSRGCLEKIHALAADRYPGLRALICRKVRSSLTQTTLVTFNDKVLPEQSGVWFHHADQEYRYPNGSIVAVAGLDDPGKILSSEWDLIYVAEATELSLEDWEILVTRLRNGAMPYQQLMADCNPGDPNHWLLERVRAGHLRLFESNHTDNPSLWDHANHAWTAAGAVYMQALDSLTGYRYKRLRLGLWVAAEGMYFTEWDPEVHVVPAVPIPPSWPRWQATDWGWTHPWCTLWGTRSPAGNIFVYREQCGTQRTIKQQAQIILRMSDGERFRNRVLDPSCWGTESNGRTKAEQYAEAGLTMAKAVNQRVAGWLLLRELLAWKPNGIDVMDGVEVPTVGFAPKLYVFGPSRDGRLKGCPNLIHAIPSMVHDPRSDEDMLKVDGDDACLVAGTQVRTRQGERPIETIRPGDVVATRDGWSTVRAAGLTRRSASVLRVELSNGRVLTGTGDHRVWTDSRGFVPLDTLRYQDILSGWQESSASASMGSSFADTQIPRTGLGVRTSRLGYQIDSRVPRTCIERFGRLRMGRSQQATTFIILTIIRSTTIWRTLRVCQPTSTTGITVRRTSLLRSRRSILTPFALSRRFGTAVMQDAPGTARTVSRRGSSVSLFTNSAASAGPHSMMSVAMHDSARTIASLPGVEPRVSTLLSGSVLSAGQYSSAIGTCPRLAVPVSVVQLSQVPNADVYNLTLSNGRPEYFANGILVHNCDTLRYLVQEMAVQADRRRPNNMTYAMRKKPS